MRDRGSNTRRLPLRVCVEGIAMPHRIIVLVEVMGKHTGACVHTDEI